MFQLYRIDCPSSNHFRLSAPLPSNVRTCYQQLALADPQFDRPVKIKMLIGRDLFSHPIHSEAEIKHTLDFSSAMEINLG